MMQWRFLFAVAVIVSFVDQFGPMVFTDKPPITSDLIRWLSNTDDSKFHSKIEKKATYKIYQNYLVLSELSKIHINLLRKLKRSVNADKWEKAIIKFCYFYGGADDAFEVERYGYLHSRYDHIILSRTSYARKVKQVMFLAFQ